MVSIRTLFKSGSRHDQPRDEGHWSEPAQCFNEQWALYIANLMHQDSHAVIKVVRYGLNLPCFPDHAQRTWREIASNRSHASRARCLLLQRTEFNCSRWSSIWSSTPSRRMSGPFEGPRELTVVSGASGRGAVFVEVRDSGSGNLIPPRTIACSIPSTRPRTMAPAWGSRSAARSSRPMADGCRQRRTSPRAQSFGSRCRSRASRRGTGRRRFPRV